MLNISMVNHNFCNEKKFKYLLNAILDNISVLKSSQYTQIEDNCISLGCMFPFSHLFNISTRKSRFSILVIIKEVHYNG